MALMNFIVFVDEHAGELEKILSGTKTMVTKEFEPSQLDQKKVGPGDTLYFLREKDKYSLRVIATVVRAFQVADNHDEILSNALKEMQPKLQLTEDQYNYWSAKKRILLVEFESAHKTPAIQIESHRISDQSEWICLEDVSLFLDKEVSKNTNFPLVT
jgi:hypothetical protein